MANIVKQNIVTKEALTEVLKGQNEILSRKNGTYPEMSVGTAGNLQGKVDRVNDYMYTTTAGTDDIESGVAEIQSIRGNAVAFNQLVKNGNFANGTEGWSLQYINNVFNLSVSNNVLTATRKEAAEGVGTIIARPPEFIKGHKYLWLFEANSNVQSAGEIVVGSAHEYAKPLTSFTANKWIKYYTFAKADGDIIPNDRVSIQLLSTCNTAQIRNCVLFDLTLIYGAGNEPTTAEEFEADYQRWFGKALSYEEYDEGSLRTAQASGIKTVGFNLSPITEFEGTTANWSHVTLFKNDCGYKGQVYFSMNVVEISDNETNSLIHVFYNDGTGNYINTTNAGVYTLLTPKNKVVSRIETLNHHFATLKITNICINFSWSGKRDGEYEPHWEETKALPITTLTSEGKVIFPDGLKRAGNVYDEIFVENGVTKAVKRVGVVDLGTLTWYAEQLGSSGKYRYTSLISQTAGLIKPTTGSSDVANILCYKYNTTSTGKLWEWPGIGIGTTAAVYVRDANFEANADSSALKASLQGVLLYYELAEPEVYIVDDFELPLAYRVDDWGTVQVVSPENSIAPSLTTRAGINAVDSIRRLPDVYLSKDEASKTYVTGASYSVGITELRNTQSSNMNIAMEAINRLNSRLGPVGNLRTATQEQYDNLETKENNTLYFIIEND